MKKIIPTIAVLLALTMGGNVTASEKESIKERICSLHDSLAGIEKELQLDSTSPRQQRLLIGEYWALLRILEVNLDRYSHLVNDPEAPLPLHSNGICNY